MSHMTREFSNGQPQCLSACNLSPSAILFYNIFLHKSSETRSDIGVEFFSFERCGLEPTNICKKISHTCCRIACLCTRELKIPCICSTCNLQKVSTVSANNRLQLDFGHLEIKKKRKKIRKLFKPSFENF